MKCIEEGFNLLVISKYSSTFSLLSIYSFGTLVNFSRVIPISPLRLWWKFISITDPFKQKSVLYFSCINASPLKLPYFNTMQNVLYYNIRFTTTMTKGKQSSVKCIMVDYLVNPMNCHPRFIWCVSYAESFVVHFNYTVPLLSKVQKELFLAHKLFQADYTFPPSFFLQEKSWCSAF